MYKLLYANAFNLDQSKVFLFGRVKPLFMEHGSNTAAYKAWSDQLTDLLQRENGQNMRNLAIR